MNKLLLIAVLALALPAHSQQTQQAQPAWDLPQLMTALAQVPSHESKFSEKKTVSLLKEPAESNGVLSYRRPDHLEKHVLQPKDEAIIVDGNEITWRDSVGRSRSMRLNANAGLAALAESIRATLTGDLNGLQKYFSVKLDGTKQQWTLTLTPIDDAMLRKVQNLHISGSDARVDTVDVLEKNGDRSVMTIGHD